jgi:hypothetical protein
MSMPHLIYTIGGEIKAPALRLLPVTWKMPEVPLSRRRSQEMTANGAEELLYRNKLSGVWRRGVGTGGLFGFDSLMLDLGIVAVEFFDQALSFLLFKKLCASPGLAAHLRFPLDDVGFVHAVAINSHRFGLKWVVTRIWQQWFPAEARKTTDVKPAVDQAAASKERHAARRLLRLAADCASI